MELSPEASFEEIAQRMEHHRFGGTVVWDIRAIFAFPIRMLQEVAKRAALQPEAFEAGIAKIDRMSHTTVPKNR